MSGPRLHRHIGKETDYLRTGKKAGQHGRKNHLALFPRKRKSSGKVFAILHPYKANQQPHRAYLDSACIDPENHKARNRTSLELLNSLDHIGFLFFCSFSIPPDGLMTE